MSMYLLILFSFLFSNICKPLEMVLLRQSSQQNMLFNGFAGSGFVLRKGGCLLVV